MFDKFRKYCKIKGVEGVPSTLYCNQFATEVAFFKGIAKNIIINNQEVKNLNIVVIKPRLSPFIGEKLFNKQKLLFFCYNILHMFACIN